MHILISNGCDSNDAARVTILLYIHVILTYTHSDLQQKVQSLHTGGTTALGPALALCVGMASNYSSSEVILCTDGISNVGVGNLE